MPLQDEVLSLERQVALAQERIEDNKRKYLRAQNSQQSMNSRLKKAADILVALEQCSGDMAASTPPAVDFTASLRNSIQFNQLSSSRAQSGPLFPMVSASTSSPQTRMNVPLVSHNSAPPTNIVMPLAGRFGTGKGKSRGRPVEAFAHCAAISLDCVSVDVEPFGFGSQIDSFKSEVAQTLGVHPSDVCWFMQQPFELPNGELLSMSSCLGSYKCTLGILLLFVANFLKATQFDRELRLYDEGFMEGVEGAHLLTCITLPLTCLLPQNNFQQRRLVYVPACMANPP